jgi:flagellar biosynthesis protein FlhG
MTRGGRSGRPLLQIVPGIGIATSARTEPPRTLALASGKGGVGKTNLAVNLALALARMGRRTLVVDGDLGLGKVDVLMGAEPRTSLAQYLYGQCDLDAAFQVGPAGVVFLAGGCGNGDLAVLDPARRERLVRGLVRAADIFDFVLLDLATGIGPNALELARRADEVLMVTTPEPTAVADAYTMTKLLHGTGPGPRFIVNRCASEAEARETFTRIAGTARSRFGAHLEFLGHVPEDPAVARAVRDRSPFLLGAPEAPASRHIRAMARRVIEERFPGGGHRMTPSRTHSTKAETRAQAA